MVEIPYESQGKFTIFCLQIQQFWVLSQTYPIRITASKDGRGVPQELRVKEWKVGRGGRQGFVPIT